MVRLNQFVVTSAAANFINESKKSLKYNKSQAVALDIK